VRISASAKLDTRARILGAAIELFGRDGWQATTTKSLAEAARIASGTLFNYFPTKEAIAAALAQETLAYAASEFLDSLEGDESLEEELFRLIWTGLRRLLPFRSFLGDALPTTLGTLTRPPHPDAGATLRSQHLELASEVLARHGVTQLSGLHLQIYWTLYLGALHYWAADNSSDQENTLALLDQSIILFVSALRDQYETEEEETAGEQGPEFSA